MRGLMVLFIMFTSLFLTGGKIALADEGHKHEPEEVIKVEDTVREGEHGEEHSNEQYDDSVKESVTEGNKKEDSHKKEDSSGVKVKSQGHSHGHGDEEVVETPPNRKILGAFGAINLSFVLIGVWNKWLRRKEEI